MDAAGIREVHAPRVALKSIARKHRFGAPTKQHPAIIAILPGNLGGVKGLNAALQRRFLLGPEPVLRHDLQNGVEWANTIKRLPSALVAW